VRLIITYVTGFHTSITWVHLGVGVVGTFQEISPQHVTCHIIAMCSLNSGLNCCWHGVAYLGLEVLIDRIQLNETKHSSDVLYNISHEPQ